MFIHFYWTFQSQMNGLGDYKVGFGDDLSITLGFGGAFYICSLLFAILLLFHCVFAYFLRNNPEAIYGSQKPHNTLAGHIRAGFHFKKYLTCYCTIMY